MSGGQVAPWVLAIALLAAPAAAAPAAKSGSPGVPSKKDAALALIQEGQSLHDAGRYDDAISRYRLALTMEPGNATAFYELAFTYHAQKDYAHCLEATREGLKHPGDEGARLYSQQGTCLDDAGRAAEAAAAYREGIAKHPHDGRLRYNYAVALYRQKKVDDAIPEVIAAIGDEPGYDSPYMMLGVLEHQRGQDVQALFAFLHYLTIDHTSERSRQAATLALGLFKEGVTTKPGGKDVQVTLSPDSVGGQGLYSMLGLSRSLAAASVHLGEDGTDADLVAGSLDSFLGIASEMSANAQHEETATAEWRLVTAPLLALAENDLGKPFGYLVAERAHINGGSEWVAKNGAKMRQLEAALAGATAPAP